MFRFQSGLQIDTEGRATREGAAVPNPFLLDFWRWKQGRLWRYTTAPSSVGIEPGDVPAMRAYLQVAASRVGETLIVDAANPVATGPNPRSNAGPSAVY